jgi:PIN domain
MGLEPPRYVFDTSVVVSALLFEQSVPGQAFYAALDRGEILLAQATATELAEVLSRKKFDRYLTREEREQFLVVLLREATVVEGRGERGHSEYCKGGKGTFWKTGKRGHSEYRQLSESHRRLQRTRLRGPLNLIVRPQSAPSTRALLPSPDTLR